MRRSVSLVFLLLLILAALQVPLAVHAQGTPKIYVRSLYTLDRYGFATINESVRFTNNGTSAVTAPSLTFGFGDLNSTVAKYNLTVANGFTLAPPPSQGGPFTINGGQTIAAGGNTSYVFSALLDGVVSTVKNGSLQVEILTSPSISTKVDTVLDVVQMPSSTTFNTAPSGFSSSLVGTNDTYWRSLSSVASPAAATSLSTVASSSSQDFTPLHVYSAQRTITVSASGAPLVTDTVTFGNMGTVPLSTLHVDILAPPNTKVTVLETTEPRLINPVTISLSGGAFSLSAFASGYPSPGVPAGENFTIAYQYPLGANLYSESGGQVTVRVSESPPIGAFVDTYTIRLSLPQGASASGPMTAVLHQATPWQDGVAKFTYGLTLGWEADAGIPAAALIFLVLLVGLFVSRTRTTTESAEGEEEETSTELASDMIMAFDEKTDLINSFWPEIEGKDPNEVDRAYFDELRGRLDSFRSRALQRLNEVKQKSASQKFSEVVNQMQATEREVDRAAKDKLNLYQQYHLRQMRKEVYERLLPQYNKRLERALNRLSDELHNVQREAKLL